MPSLPGRDQLHAQAERDVAFSNSTLRAVLGGRRKSWMVGVHGSPVRPTPRPTGAQLSLGTQQTLLPCPKANAAVLPSPAPSDEPSPVLSHALRSPTIDYSVSDNQPSIASISATGGGGDGGGISTANHENQEASRPQLGSSSYRFPTEIFEQHNTQRITPVLKLPSMQTRADVRSYEQLPRECQQFHSSSTTSDVSSRVIMAPVSPTMSIPLPSPDQFQAPALRGVQYPIHQPSNYTSFSNIGVDRRPQRSRTTDYPTLKIKLPCLDEQIQTLNKDKSAAGSLLARRFKLLRIACNDEDVFYVALHQLFCLWSLRRDVLASISSLKDPEVLREGVGILSAILRTNDAFSASYLQWFTDFPHPLDKGNISTGYAQALFRVDVFLNNLVMKFPALEARVATRGYPPLVKELVEGLGLHSILFQGMIFRYSRHGLGFPDDERGDAIFQEDQRAWRALSERANTSNAPTKREIRDHCAHIKGLYLSLSQKRVARLVPLAQQSAAGLGIPESRSMMSTPASFSEPGVHQAQTSTNQSLGGIELSTPAVSLNPPLQSGFTQVPVPSQVWRDTCGGSTGHGAVYNVPSYQQAQSSSSIMQPSVSQRDKHQLHVDEQRNQQYLMHLQLQEQERQIMENQQQQTRLQQQAQHQRQALDHLRGQQQAAHQQQSQMQQNINKRAAYSSYQQTTHLPQANQQQEITQQQALNQLSIQQHHQHQDVFQHQRGQRQQAQNMQQVLTMNRAYARRIPPAAPAQAGSFPPRSNNLSTSASVIAAPGSSIRQQTSVAVTRSVPYQSHQLDSDLQAYGAMNPLQRPLIPPQGFNHPPQHPQPDYMALHQAHLRSPVLVPSTPTVTVMDQKPEQRFYQYVSHCAVGPVRLPMTLSVSSFDFRLSDADFILLAKDEIVGVEPKRSVKRLFSSDTLQYRIRCIRTKPATISCRIEDWVVSDTAWPPTVFLEINGQSLEIRRKGQHGKDLPVDITRQVMSAGKGACNEARISIPKSRKQTQDSIYFFAIEVIGVVRHNEIMSRCLKSQRIALEDTVDGIKKSLAGPADDDDEISMVPSDLTIDLRDPFSSSIFNIPARGKSCLHRESFDLETFLTTRDIKTKMDGQPVPADVWKCPICKADARPHNLRIDDFLVFIRARLGEEDKLDVKAILVSADGSWKPKPEAESVSRKRKAKTEGPNDGSDDDDEDTPPPRKKVMKEGEEKVIVINIDSD